MKIEIWSDFACPFCYLGHARLQQALGEAGLLASAKIVFRSFQLDVNATSHPGEDIHTLISRKYGISYEEAKASNQRIISAAEGAGLHYDFDNLKPGNTGLAHQAAKYAQSIGMEQELVERFFKAYFEEGVDLGIEENLLALAAEVNVEEGPLKDALAAGTFKAEVMEDQKQAREKGIRGVPHIVIDDRFTVSGAQSVAYFVQVLREAMAS